MVTWNTQIFIFGWCEHILVGISYVCLFIDFGPISYLKQFLGNYPIFICLYFVF